MKLTCFALAALALLLTGCHHDDVVYSADGKTVTVSKDGSGSTITGPDGTKVNISGDGTKMTGTNDKGESFSVGGGVSEADLGLPYYPGSEEQKGSSSTQDLPKQKIVMCIRTSKDDPEKVGEFYKDKMEGQSPSNSTAGDVKVMSMLGKLKNGSEASVSATRQGSKDTLINVMVTTKK
jgi:hypothetical protein